MLSYPDDSNSQRKGFLWLVDVEKAGEQDLGEADQTASTARNQRGVNACASPAFSFLCNPISRCREGGWDLPSTQSKQPL